MTAVHAAKFAAGKFGESKPQPLPTSSMAYDG